MHFRHIVAHNGVVMAGWGVLVMATLLVASAAEARTHHRAPCRLIEIVDARGVRFLGEERKNRSFRDWQSGLRLW
jgi:hypothetical protein